ncbi:MAG TPA: hypothetical protein VL633_12800 [Bacteroidota bacterium]|jgi:hypothetical protein|nr:hypothetical protein [Bacteroidota bacterium]
METNRNKMNEDVTTDRAMVTGMFADRESTLHAYNTLHDKGYTKDEINLIMSDETRKKHFSGDMKGTEIGTKAAEGAGKGMAIGGTVGAVAGLIAAIGTSIVVPGLGLLIVGPLAAGLAGAGAGGLTGGIIGALVGSGIPEERAKLYESGVKDGRIVMGVHPHNDEDAEYFEKAWSNGKSGDVRK